jgi:thiamine pyrophosphokinase
MRALILINGELRDPELLRRLFRPGDLLVAADGGARHALAIGLAPHLLVGDLDSIDPATVDALRAQGTQVERHPVAKDQTDLELAIERALREGADEVLLLGATGGRLDQTLANLLVLAQRDWGVPLRLVEEEQVATLLRGPGALRVADAAGSTLSVIPLSAEVTGITYQGLEYPLEGATLAFGSTRGISNVVCAAEASVTVESGLLLVIVGLDAALGAG